MAVSYVFVIAAAIAVMINVISFKLCMDTMKEDPNLKEKMQSRFFLLLAIGEVIPIILIIYGFMNLQKAAEMNELYMPGLIVLVLIGFAALFITLQRMVGVPKEIAAFSKSFATVALGTTTAIPIIAIVAMVTMIP